jgi:non-specific serine/threonine protein kinase
LLREPGREFSATDLVRFANGAPLVQSMGDPALSVVSGLGDAGDRLDARARASYRERLREIEEELAEAERHGDLGRLDRVSEEREALLAEVVAAAHGRRAASHVENARLSVSKAIRAALEKIAERHPELGAHLSATIRRGYLCTYVPDPRLRHGNRILEPTR